MGMTTTNRALESRRPVAGPLKTLMTGYQIWGPANACDTAELSNMFRMSAADLLDSMHPLAQEGLVRIDHERGTVSLTEAGARAMALVPSGFDS